MGRLCYVPICWQLSGLFQMRDGCNKTKHLLASLLFSIVCKLFNYHICTKIPNFVCTESMRTLRVDRRRARVDSLVSMSFLLLRIGSPFVDRRGGQGLPLLRERLLVT